MFPALAQAELWDDYTIQSWCLLLLFAILFQYLFLTPQFLTALHFWGRGDAPGSQATYLSIYCKGGFRALTLEMLMAGTGRYLTARMMNCFIDQIPMSRFTSIFPINSPFPLNNNSVTQTSTLKSCNSKYEWTTKPPTLCSNMPKTIFFPSSPVSPASIYIVFFIK